jgi:hypothetical protein
VAALAAQVQEAQARYQQWAVVQPPASQAQAMAPETASPASLGGEASPATRELDGREGTGLVLETEEELTGLVLGEQALEAAEAVVEASLATGGGVIRCPPPSARAQSQLWPYTSLSTCRWRRARNGCAARD